MEVDLHIHCGSHKLPAPPFPQPVSGEPGERLGANGVIFYSVLKTLDRSRAQGPDLDPTEHEQEEEQGYQIITRSRSRKLAQKPRRKRLITSGDTLKCICRSIENGARLKFNVKLVCGDNECTHRIAHGLLHAPDESLSRILTEELKCPICLDVLVDPVISNCSHTFCCTCLSQWKKLNDPGCPLCRKPLLTRMRSRCLSNLARRFEACQGGT